MSGLLALLAVGAFLFFIIGCFATPSSGLYPHGGMSWGCAASFVLGGLGLLYLIKITEGGIVAILVGLAIFAKLGYDYMNERKRPKAK